MLGWTEGEDGYLKDAEEQQFRYYLRLEGEESTYSGNGQTVTLPNVSGEFAVFTDKMSGKEEQNLEAELEKHYRILASLRMVEES